MCALVLKETGLLPHVNPGVMTRDEIASLREVSASLGIMLEIDQRAAVRAAAACITARPTRRPRCGWRRCGSAGELAVPFTTGILIGIGETRAERIEALLAIRDLHAATATSRK